MIRSTSKVFRNWPFTVIEAVNGFRPLIENGQRDTGIKTGEPSGKQFVVSKVAFMSVSPPR